jgi:hypothetical protein
MPGTIRMKLPPALRRAGLDSLRKTSVGMGLPEPSPSAARAALAPPRATQPSAPTPAYPAWSPGVDRAAYPPREPASRGTPAAAPPTEIERARRRRQSRLLGLAALSAATLVLVIGLVTGLARERGGDPPPAARPSPLEPLASPVIPAGNTPASPALAPPGLQPAPPAASASAPADRRTSPALARPGLDLEVMAAAIGAESSAVRSCSPGATEQARVRITFSSDGHVLGAKTINAPYAGTRQGSCIEERLRQIAIPPFQGKPVSVETAIGPLLPRGARLAYAGGLVVSMGKRSDALRLRLLAGWTGLEPAASGVTGRRYNQLNYHPRTQLDSGERHAQSANHVALRQQRVASFTTAHDLRTCSST